MMRLTRAVLAAAAIASAVLTEARADDYADLLALFQSWRATETPARLDGAPDYTRAGLAKRRAAVATLRDRLDAMDVGDWSTAQQIDYAIVRAEMNGFTFYLDVLKPWSRDPAFYKQVWTYQSDTPSHEGPVNHALIELWTYAFPLSPEAQDKLATDLRTVAPLLAQARGNLTGNARDLWVAGAKTMETQSADLAALRERLENPSIPLLAALTQAQGATAEFARWLKAQAPQKDGPSGIGKDNYTWMLQNVHLVPMTWEDEVALLRRELKRAHASLRLEEHRNRNLPPLEPVATPEAYEERALDRVDKYVAFMTDNAIVPPADYLAPALLERIGAFVPAEKRNFFHQAMHREPMTLWTHFYHWWDLALMNAAPHESPVRRGPLLYNIWDSRAEGVATAMEEMALHAGLYDDNPRAREIVWIMQAQRAARGLASLYAHADEMTMAEASAFHVKWTPRGWMKPNLDLLGFEQQLYLRQPGYGTSYVTGKALIEELFADRMRQRLEEAGADYPPSAFFAELDAAGVIPVSLIWWELTGEAAPAATE
ncbi:MAG: hypothetical protein AAGC56_07490 [Pseudomonadota bacterium]